MTRNSNCFDSKGPVATRRGVGVVLLGVALGAAPATAPAQSVTERLSAAAPVAGARFGDALAMSGGTLIVGAPGANQVHVFEHARGAGFGAIQVLSPASLPATARFGAAVALDGDRLAVGAPGAEVVFVFERQADGTFGGTVQVQAATPQAGAGFGGTVAMRAGRLLVGAPFQDARTGAAWVLDRQTDGSFAAVAMLRPAGVGGGDEFGTCVTFDDDGSTLFVSAVQDDDGGVDAGAVYVLEEQGGAFTVRAKLVAPDSAGIDRAGRALSVAGDVLAVGVRGDDDGGREAGSVKLWDRASGAFAYAGMLIAPDRTQGDLFGHSVALHGRRALVGAIARDGNAFVRDSGKAYLFERDASGVYTFVEGFDSPALEVSGWFGSAVALADRGLAIGRSGGFGGAGEVVARFDPIRVDPAVSTIDVDPDSVDLGAEATVTVVPRDALGAPVGTGLSVTISTTLGQMLGVVVDHGDGRYTQRVLADAAGTAEISAAVDGVALLSTASLSVREQLPQVRIAGQRRDGTILPFESIQQAIDAVEREDLFRVMVAPGVYEEVVRIDRHRDLELIGLASFGPVTIRGLRITRSAGVTVEGLHLQSDRRGCGGVRVGIGARQVVLRGLFVQGTRRHAGVLIGPICRDVTLESCRVEDAAGDGIRVLGLVHGLTIQGCAVVGSARSGIDLGPGVRDVLVTASALLDNGTRGRGRDGYGIVRDGGCRRWTQPEDVTLIGNDVRGNRGREQRGRSTPDFGNYHLMIDATDDQAPFGR